MIIQKLLQMQIWECWMRHFSKVKRVSYLRKKLFLITDCWLYSIFLKIKNMPSIFHYFCQFSLVTLDQYVQFSKMSLLENEDESKFRYKCRILLKFLYKHYNNMNTYSLCMMWFLRIELINNDWIWLEPLWLVMF